MHVVKLVQKYVVNYIIQNLMRIMDRRDAYHSVQAVFLHFTINGRQPDIQQFGRLYFIPVGVIKYPHDMLTLYTGQLEGR
jgi:hypothetical protein